VFVPIIFLAASVCDAQQQRGSAPYSVNDPSGLILNPGDVLRIEVWQQKEYSCECPIGADGSITHPLYRELKVTGIPLSEVESRLRVFLAKYLAAPTFDLQPLLRVVVAGEVRQPNIYTVPPGTTVAQVIFRAGGPSDRGRLDDIRLVRDVSSQKLDLTRPELAAARMEVHSGDQIIVGRRRSIMQDVIAPSSSVIAAVAALTAVIIQLQIQRK
jgi:protein involved in polysaccharide export with SLBB domain